MHAPGWGSAPGGIHLVHVTADRRILTGWLCFAE
jgi:hypothetical protein